MACNVDRRLFVSHSLLSALYIWAMKLADRQQWSQCSPSFKRATKRKKFPKTFFVEQKRSKNNNAKVYYTLSLGLSLSLVWKSSIFREAENKRERINHPDVKLRKSFLRDSVYT